MDRDYDTYKHIPFTLLTSFQSTYLLSSVLGTLCGCSTLVQGSHDCMTTHPVVYLQNGQKISRVSVEMPTGAVGMLIVRFFFGRRVRCHGRVLVRNVNVARGRMIDQS